MRAPGQYKASEARSRYHSCERSSPNTIVYGGGQGGVRQGVR